MGPWSCGAEPQELRVAGLQADLASFPLRPVEWPWAVPTSTARGRSGGISSQLPGRARGGGDGESALPGQDAPHPPAVSAGPHSHVQMRPGVLAETSGRLTYLYVMCLCVLSHRRARGRPSDHFRRPRHSSPGSSSSSVVAPDPDSPKSLFL